jgi:preprotein translocase subunit SecB
VPFETESGSYRQFEIKDENNLESLRIRTSSVLFPYVRLTVSSLTFHRRDTAVLFADD